MAQLQRVLFVTGKLAEPALRRVVADFPNRFAIQPEVAVLPITVAALLTTDWVHNHLKPGQQFSRVLLPGYCRGELESLKETLSATVERGPKDLNDLPEYLGGVSQQIPLDKYDIEIIAEINDAPRLTHAELLAIAQRYRNVGADVIDLGCDPGSTWTTIADAVKLLRDQSIRVSVDSFNAEEIAAATKAGAELVLSVNSSNIAAAADWGCEVIAIPDTPRDLASLGRTIEQLEKKRVPYRLDPILEPINFGFSESLGRYLETRQRFPGARMMMGVGNLTELTETDSAGINLLLLGFCQEQKITSVLTTEVANWCRNCIQELDLGRRILSAAHSKNMLPKSVSPALLQLRDRKLKTPSESELIELAAQITDRNYRIFIDGSSIHVINGSMHLRGNDPFELLQHIRERDEKLTPEHAFYLGYELSKAATALTLGKNYVQDQALRWGYLTREEIHHGP